LKYVPEEVFMSWCKGLHSHSGEITVNWRYFSASISQVRTHPYFLNYHTKKHTRTHFILNYTSKE